MHWAKMMGIYMDTNQISMLTFHDALRENDGIPKKNHDRMSEWTNHNTVNTGMMASGKPTRVSITSQIHYQRITMKTVSVPGFISETENYSVTSQPITREHIILSSQECLHQESPQHKMQKKRMPLMVNVLLPPDQDITKSKPTYSSHKVNL